MISPKEQIEFILEVERPQGTVDGRIQMRDMSQPYLEADKRFVCNIVDAKPEFVEFMITAVNKAM